MAPRVPAPRSSRVPEPKSSTLLPAAWDVPTEFRERLGVEAGRQRTMSAEGHLLLVLHAPPTPDTARREGRFFWRDPSGRWTPAGASPAQPGVGELITDYQRAIDALQQSEDSATTARDYFNLLNRLTPLLRSTRNLHKALEDARSTARDDRQLLVWRDQSYALERSAELLTEDAKNALDFAVAQRAEEEVEANRRIAVASHRLNVMAALFLPLATMAAVLGMNLDHGLQAWDVTYAPLLTIGVLGTGLLCGFLLALFITREP
jgi:hypothetical protein